MILFYSLIINYLIVFSLLLIGNVFSNTNFLKGYIKKILVGYCLFIILNYFLFFIFYLTIKIILLVWLVIIIIFIYISKKKINYQLFSFDILKYIVPITLVYILPAIVYGEQFYVFRGNHWDLFSYLSIGSLFNEVSFRAVIEGNLPNYFYHFQDIKDLASVRNLASYMLALFINIKILDIYLLVYLFKIFLIILSTFSILNLLESLKIRNQKEKYLISMIFPFSFWILYIFEIDSISHLISLPIFILVVSETFNLNKYIQKSNKNYLIYFSIINSALFLVYPEIFLVSLLIIFVNFCVEIYENKKLVKNYFVFFSKLSLIFLAITLFAFKTNYIFLYTQINTALSQSHDWWGYYGAFMLGRDNLILDRNMVLMIGDFFNNNNIFETLKYVIHLHFDKGYNYFYLNFLPSFFGLYFLTIGKIQSFYDYIHLTLLLLLIFFLIIQIVRNFTALRSNKKIILNLIIFFLISLILIIKGNPWSLVKLYFYLSPFIFLFTVLSYRKTKIKILLNVNYFFVILIILFPIYKYSSFNSGIGRLDSFPTIIHPSMKKNFKWEIESEKLSKCEYITVNTEKYFEKSYLIIKFLHESINSNIIGINKNDNNNKCKLSIKNKGFFIEQL